MDKIIMIGNPGAGKSTLLTCLVDGTTQFPSGVAIGKRATTNLQEVEYHGTTYLDTLGLADVQLRKRAAAAIEEAFKTGGNFRIFFVLTLEYGRVRPDDNDTPVVPVFLADVGSDGQQINFQKFDFGVKFQDTPHARGKTAQAMLEQLRYQPRPHAPAPTEPTSQAVDSTSKPPISPTNIGEGAQLPTPQDTLSASPASQDNVANQTRPAALLGNKPIQKMVKRKQLRITAKRPKLTSPKRALMVQPRQTEPSNTSPAIQDTIAVPPYIVPLAVQPDSTVVVESISATTSTASPSCSACSSTNAAVSPSTPDSQQSTTALPPATAVQPESVAPIDATSTSAVSTSFFIAASPSGSYGSKDADPGSITANEPLPAAPFDNNTIKLLLSAVVLVVVSSALTFALARRK